LYLSILSRYPIEEESKIYNAYLKTNNNNRRQSAIDLAWALVNSAEFVYRH
jgi:hypothetical protein